MFAHPPAPADLTDQILLARAEHAYLLEKLEVLEGVDLTDEVA